MYRIKGCPVPIYQDEGELNRLLELVKEGIWGIGAMWKASK